MTIGTAVRHSDRERRDVSVETIAQFRDAPIIICASPLRTLL
jgi:hypothetical protein